MAKKRSHFIDIINGTRVCHFAENEGKDVHDSSCTWGHVLILCPIFNTNFYDTTMDVQGEGCCCCGAFLGVSRITVQKHDYITLFSLGETGSYFMEKTISGFLSNVPRQLCLDKQFKLNIRAN